MNQKSMSRREWIAGAFATTLLSACTNNMTPLTSTVGNDPLGSAGNARNPAATPLPTDNKTCALIPAETAGPYPAHDDSALNVLRIPGIERSDIRSSLNAGGYTGSAVAQGAPLTLTLNLVNVAKGCAPLAGYVIYIWHCDANGKYSMYSPGVTAETYLRGIQRTDSNGSATFKTIFPGCYEGRVTHIHFEVFPSIAQAVDDASILRTSQLTFPLVATNAIYSNDPLYSISKSNASRITFASDDVFADGTAYQTASIVGNNTAGYASSLTVGINR